MADESVSSEAVAPLLSGVSSAAFSESSAFDFSSLNIDVGTWDDIVASGVLDVALNGTVDDSANMTELIQNILKDNAFVDTELPPGWDASDPLQQVTLLNLRPNSTNANSNATDQLQQGNASNTNSSRSFCQLIFTLDKFKPPQFNRSKALVRTEDIAIRFGATTNMTTALKGSSTTSQKLDYFWGLIASSLVVGGIFFAWCVLIASFKWRGHTKVGFLAGRFVLPNAPSDEGDDDDDDDHEEDDEKLEDVTENEEAYDGKKMSEERKEVAVASKQIGKPSVVEHETRQVTSGTVLGVSEDLDASQQDLSASSHSNSKSTSSMDETIDDGVHKKKFDKYQVWIDACRHQQIRIFRARVVLVILCLCNITAGCLFCIYGNHYIDKSVGTTNDALQQLQGLTLGAVNLVDEFLEKSNRTQTAAQKVLDEANNLERTCPSIGYEQRQLICQAITPITENCNFDALPFNLGKKLNPVAHIVNQALTESRKQLEMLRWSMYELNRDLQVYEEATYHLKWCFWVGFGFTVALIVCCCVMIFGIWRSHLGTFNNRMDHLRRRYLVPIFCFLVLTAFAFTEAFLIGAVALADWCSPGPEDKMKFIVSYMLKDAPSEDMLHLVMFYVHGCKEGSGFDFGSFGSVGLQEQFGGMVDDLMESASFSDFIHLVDETAWLGECGSNTLHLWMDYANRLEELLCLLTGSLEEFLRFFWCRQWSPVYTLFMHQAICYDGQNGMTWVAGAMLAVTFFSFCILMLRAGAFESLEEAEYLRQLREDREQAKHCCGRCYRFFCVCCYYRSPEGLAEEQEGDFVIDA